MIESERRELADLLDALDDVLDTIDDLPDAAAEAALALVRIATGRTRRLLPSPRGLAVVPRLPFASGLVLLVSTLAAAV